MNDTDKIAPGAYLLAEVRGDGFAALDNFTLRSWPDRLNRWLDYLPGYWGAKLPPVGTGNASALVTIQAPKWSPASALSLGDARRMLSDLVGGVDVVSLKVTGANPATPAQVAQAAKDADARSPLAIIGNAAENIAAWVVVGLVVAVVLSKGGKR